MANQKHNEKITYDLRRAACRLGASAATLFDCHARAEEGAGRDPGPAPSLLMPTGDRVVDALRLARQRLAITAHNMRHLVDRIAREDRRAK